MNYDLLVIGGGAAGFFGAIRAAELHPEWNIIILEKSNKVLQKVKVSGGGRCNVTHACFAPNDMVKNYPRGEKELLGPFHRFLCGDMMAWLNERDVPTVIEEDGRVFPASNKSQSVIDCFIRESHRLGIGVKYQSDVSGLSRVDKLWHIESSQGIFKSRNVLFGTGSSTRIWAVLENLGHHISPIAPSLFTFNIKSPMLEGLPGISVPDAELFVQGSQLRQFGPLLITHKGLSGPAVLRLSAWGALLLEAQNYQFQLGVNWVGMPEESVRVSLQKLRDTHAKISPMYYNPFGLPKRLWRRMVEYSGVTAKNWAESSKKELLSLADLISNCLLDVKGKNTFKEEFVTCGGVDLREVDFKKMQSKLFVGIFFAGEVLNIDAITGGFNFQSAWTTAWIASEGME